MTNSSFNIVLYEPQIPQNTGNIARLCACTGSSLYLVGKLGFHITDRHVKRAGLDYWDSVNIQTVSTLTELQEQFPDSNFYYLSTKATKKYTEITYQKGDFLVFGSETKGLPEEIILKNHDNSLTIPMLDDQRSLNLSNSVSIVLYEALRQVGF
ncbi:MAG: tRNA (uridine(34)/cytosine(34)/5-carboxymethylaminomethyluridine(34)-2'-O)-methyltransferase TrmL [Candidatus Melainabacteria bacterium GWA2_34_9]|nr:MAG: tRNA (uridine(34)/cytosine(34)/5-carboxymethylaminomethyluridine(34)-2'-O)-methyltransferase TrmL [Candidatus Melainabacteria bacterium GWA2_34_9]